MKSKEEILQENILNTIKAPDTSTFDSWLHMYMLLDPSPALNCIVKPSMDTYAQDQSILFAEWIVDNGWVLYPGSLGVWADISTEGRVATTRDLYEIFKKQLP